MVDGGAAAKAKPKNKSGGVRSHTGDYSAALNTETGRMGEFQGRKPDSTETTGGGGGDLRDWRKSLIKGWGGEAGTSEGSRGRRQVRWEMEIQTRPTHPSTTH